MPKKKATLAGTAVAVVPASLNPVQNDKKSHGQLSKESAGKAAEMDFDDDTPMDDLPYSTDVMDFDVEKINKNRSMLNSGEWGKYYRGLKKGVDELVSTATVREIAKGIFSKNPSQKQLKNIGKFLNTISSVRLPTEIVGHNTVDGSSTGQHPTDNSLAVYNTSGKNHGSFDLGRRNAVVKTFVEHVSNGSSWQKTMRAVIAKSITYTLNTFAAPAKAKNQKPYATLTEQALKKHTADREQAKELAKYFGAGQRPGTDNSIDRDWEQDNRSDVSEDRYIDDDFEKNKRINKNNGGTTTNTLANTITSAKPKKKVPLKALKNKKVKVSLKAPKKTGGKTGAALKYKKAAKPKRRTSLRIKNKNKSLNRKKK